MLGKNHVILGSFLWITLLPYLIASKIIVIDSVFQLALSTLVVTGASILPDFDEPNASPVREFWIFGRFGSKIFRKMMGGHRERAHSFLFPIVMFIITMAFSLIYTDTGNTAIDYIQRVPVTFICFVCVILGIVLLGKGLKKWGFKNIGRLVAWPCGLLVLAIVVLGNENLLMYLPDLEKYGFGVELNPKDWLPHVIGFGCFFHLVGDFPTNYGIPFFMPFFKTKAGRYKRIRMPFFHFRVGSKTENIIASFLGFMFLLSCIYTFFIYDWKF